MKHWLGISVWGILIAAAIGFAAFAFILKDLPKPEEFENRKVNQSTKIYDRTGTVLLYEIHGEEKRTVIPFEAIPELAKKATIAIEDNNFYTHPAFDWRSIVRAIITDLLHQRLAQGGSTITQQLAKNAFLSSEKTIIRKVKELLVALELEKRYTKDQVLNLYLNQIPYGGNAYGIEAASQTFFEKSAKDLTLPEIAVLVSLPKAPSYYSPWGNHLDELLQRKNYVLEQMFASGYIDKTQKTKAQNVKLVFAPKATTIKAPHFTLAVQEYLNNKYGETFVEGAGLKVLTTLDWKLQQLAEKVVLEGAQRNTDLYQGHNAALVAQDATSGQVLALAGSKDYFAAPEPVNCTPGKNCLFEGNFNVAAQGLRQPGSAMKPLVYVTAFEKGYSPDTVLFDLPTEFAANNPHCPLLVDFTNEKDECFHPENFDHLFRGPVNLRNALAQSINIPAVKTLYLAGIDNVLKTAKNLGVTTLTERGRYGLSLVLGGGEVRLTELVGAYSVFAQDGVKHPQTFVLSVEDSKGNSLENFQSKPTQVVEPQYVRLLNDTLADVKARSGLFSGSLGLTTFPGYEVALKTGTTNDYRDAWTMGYTPTLVVGVWAGNNDNSPMQRQGSSILAALPIWNAFMKEVITTQPLTTFPKPDPINAEKAVLRGDHIVKFRSGNQTSTQIHTILFYLDKNNPNGPRPAHPEEDSQFPNWEEPTLRWAEQNFTNFYQTYNQLISPEATEESLTTSLLPEITFLTPQNGDFLKSTTLLIQVNLNSGVPISHIQVFFNDRLIDTRQGEFISPFLYQNKISLTKTEVQNALKIKVLNKNNQWGEKTVILFK